MVPDYVQPFLDKLRKVKRSGNGWSALCPAHEDSTSSLSVSIGEKGIVCNCHANCTVDNIVAAMGLTMADLFDPATKKSSSKTKETVYTYEDENGDMLFQVVRMVKDGKKDFRQRKPDGGGGWTWSTTGVRKPLYHLQSVLSAVRDGKEVWVVEGEKDVQTLESKGLIATCNPGGAGTWLPEHTKALKGGKVVVCVDNDGPGYKHGLTVVEELQEVATVRVVAPPEPHNDATDAITAGLAPSSFPAINLSEAIGDFDPMRELITEIRQVQQRGGAFPKQLNQARAILDRAEVREEVDKFGRLVKWTTFLAEPVDGYDWVIPSLLERGERVVLVGGEGHGKSMLGRQVALLTAMGIHPFRKTNIEAKTTLFIDLENPEKIIRRTSKSIYTAAKELRPYSEEVPAHLLVKPNGIDLLNKAHRVEIDRLVAQVQPDLLFIGPIYKAYTETTGKTIGAVITEVVKFLDYIRDTYNCALWLEHHAPLGQDGSRVLRPVDSGVWSRWPEFGISIKPDLAAPGVFELNHFRGGRDQRDWPKRLHRGGAFPWSAEY